MLRIADFLQRYSQVRHNEDRKMGQAEALAKMRKDPNAPKDFKVQAREQAGNGDADRVDVYLYDVIGWPFIEAQDLVNAVPAGAASIGLHINSPGGDVFEGMAIYNFFTSHQAEVQVSVDGVAASSASLVAMSGSRVEMAPASLFMIHQPWAIMLGDAEELRKEADLLDKISGIFAQEYARRTGKSESELLQLMRDETWFTPQEALDAGFADQVTGGGQAGARARFDLSMFANHPQYQQFGRAASFRPAGTTTSFAEDDDMNKKLRALLEKKGLDPQATDEQAWAFLASLEAKSEGLTPEEQKEVNGLKGYSQEDLDQARKEAAKAERERQAAIRKNVMAAGLDDAFAQELINEECSIEKARDKIFAKMEETNPPFGAGAFRVEGHEQDKVRAAATDGMLLRSGQRLEKPAPGAEDFRGYEIASLIRDMLSREGHDVTRLSSRRAIADYVFRSRNAAMTTSDFPSIFRDVQNKTLLRAYTEYPATWPVWTNRTTATDFKEQYGISLSNAPDLKLVNQAGEYTYGELSDNQESYRLFKFGRLLMLTWEMIINDDLRALVRYPQLMGNAARRKESDYVYDLLVSNPTMNDGTNLFHADHNNLATANLDVVGQDGLEAGRAAMRKQKGMQGENLDLRPAFLLVPVAQETTSEVLLRSRGSLDAEANAGVVNPWYNRLAPVAEPRLDDDSVKSWYLTADPNQADTIEVAYLDGYEAPTIDEQEEFTRDALTWKVRHVFGAGVMDHRTFWKNPGE
jgi:ATP-dependent protease ClpP protease subunit